MEGSPINDARMAITASSLAGDAGAVYRIVGDLLDEGVPFEAVLFDLLLESESQVGARWQQGDYLVAEEHAITAVIETVVSLLAGSLSRPVDGKSVVVATAEGDHHSLPGRAVAAHLLYLGYQSTFLGANVPASDLTEFLAVEAPEALVLSSAMVQPMFRVREAIRGSHAMGVPVVGGGRGFGVSGEWALLLGADMWVAKPRDVAETIETWDPDIVAAEAGALEPSARMEEIWGRRSLIAAQALEMMATFNGDFDGRLQTEIEILLGATLAAELVNSQEPIHETLAWQASTLVAHGYLPPPDLVTPLAEILASYGTDVHQRLLEARS